MDLTREESLEVLVKTRQIHSAFYGEGNTLGICTKIDNQSERIAVLEKADAKRAVLSMVVTVIFNGVLGLFSWLKN